MSGDRKRTDYGVAIRSIGHSGRKEVWDKTALASPEAGNYQEPAHGKKRTVK